MAAIGVLSPDKNLEQHIRQLGGLPEALEDAEYPVMDDEENPSGMGDVE